MKCSRIIQSWTSQDFFHFSWILNSFFACSLLGILYSSAGGKAFQRGHQPGTQFSPSAAVLGRKISSAAVLFVFFAAAHLWTICSAVELPPAVTPHQQQLLLSRHASSLSLRLVSDSFCGSK